MRVLLITRNLPPLRGGMERLNLGVVTALASKVELVVIGPAGCRAHLPKQVAVYEVPVVSLPLFFLKVMELAWRLGRDHFDLVIAGSGLTAPMALLAAKRSGARSLAYVHGLDVTTKNLVYRMFWLTAMRRMDAAIANSANTADLAMRAAVAQGNVAVVHPGVELPLSTESSNNDFRARFQLDDAPMLLSVGRLTERKGLAEFVDLAMPLIVARFPGVRLVVIGDEAPDALSRSANEPAAKLIEAIARHCLQKHIIRLGPCDEITLKNAYAAADIHVFPVKQVSGDIEGFGMVAIEAAAHGLPTIAFAVGGVPDAVGDGVSGWLLPPGDYDGFAARVCKVIAAKDGGSLHGSARLFAKDFSWPLFGERLWARVQQVVSGVSFNGAAGGAAHKRGHAVLDLVSRRAKAYKIERLIKLRAKTRPIKILEIGCGSGGIAHYFSQHPHIICDVVAVDVNDARQISDGYRFTLVESVELPFDNETFDVVLTNHVIEHVGDDEAQAKHLAEIRRVLCPDGSAYLAVPNRWMLVEPHYRLIFLSWWPERWRSSWLRLFRKGVFYDCRPFSRGRLESLLTKSQFQFEQLHAEALRAMFEIESPDAPLWRYCLKHIPDFVYATFGAIFPTLIYRLKPV